jgi:hypothetical protein
MKRRTIITSMPLAILGITTAKGNLGPVGPVPTNTSGALDDRALNYALEIMTEASTSSGPSTFVAFAHHVATLAAAGDCKAIRAIAERLTDHLYAEHNRYNETRETWIAETIGHFEECRQADDPDLAEAQQEAALYRSNVRHDRREAAARC